ncbi:MAG: nucleotidyltransferase domain-containing protein, partial [Candidatus Nanohaloarchaea archaeon]|nr:nucleotidyltransferase domain-containing protein [Candidatus Nanohaloarchaea archaeon]
DTADIERSVLQHSEQLDSLVETAPDIDMSDYTSYDYVKLSDGTVFILHGDRQPVGWLRGIPVYGPDQHGDRELDGTSYAKYPLGQKAEMDASFYRDSPDEQRSYQFPVTEVEEHFDPQDRTEDALDRLSREKQSVYRQIEAIVEDEGGDLALVGSHLLGLQTDDSDLDCAVISKEPIIDRVYDRLRNRDNVEETIEEAQRRITKTEKKKGAYSTRTIEKTYNIVREVTELTVDGIEADLIPTHEPGTWQGYRLLAGDEELAEQEVEGTVVDASHAHHDPVQYTIDTGSGTVDIVTFLPIFKDGFEKGDDVTVFGDRTADASTVYLREDDHYMGPASSFIQRLLGRDGGEIVMEQPEQGPSSGSTWTY